MNSITVERLPELYELMKIMESSVSNPFSVLGKINSTWLNKLSDLAISCLKPNYSEINDNVLKELIQRNSMKFFAHMCEQNLKMSDEDTDTNIEINCTGKYRLFYRKGVKSREATQRNLSKRPWPGANASALLSWRPAHMSSPAFSSALRGNMQIPALPDRIYG